MESKHSPERVNYSTYSANQDERSSENPFSHSKAFDKTFKSYNVTPSKTSFKQTKIKNIFESYLPSNRLSPKQKEELSFNSKNKSQKEDSKGLDIDSYLNNALNNNSYKKHKSKLAKLKYSNYAYDKRNSSIIRITSTSDIHSLNSNEKTLVHKSQIPTFKPDLLKIKQKHIQLPFSSLSSLPNEGLMEIVAFLGKDFTQMYTSAKQIKNRMVDCFKEQFEDISSSFKLTYSELLNVAKASITVKLTTTKIFINLKVLSKLKTSLFEGKTVTLSSIYRIKGLEEPLNSVFRFDFLFRTQITRWISRELAKFHTSGSKLTYSQPIECFSAGDFAWVNVNLLSPNGLVEQHTWLRPTSSKLGYIGDKAFKQLHNHKEVVDFDLSRFSDVEMEKKNWCSIEQYPFNEKDLIEAKISEVYGKCFDVAKIFFDDVGFYLFKIFLVASRLGEVEDDKNVNIILRVKDVSEKVTNYVKKNGLVYDDNDAIEMRKGDSIVLYITMDKYV